MTKRTLTVQLPLYYFSLWSGKCQSSRRCSIWGIQTQSVVEPGFNTSHPPLSSFNIWIHAISTRNSQAAFDIQDWKSLKVIYLEILCLWTSSLAGRSVLQNNKKKFSKWIPWGFCRFRLEVDQQSGGSTYSLEADQAIRSPYFGSYIIRVQCLS